MIPQLQPPQRRPQQRSQGDVHTKKQRPRGPEYPDQELWDQAGAAARRIIRRFNIPDTTENWRWIQHEVADALRPLG
jgi:hypothetical protein